VLLVTNWLHNNQAGWRSPNSVRPRWHGGPRTRRSPDSVTQMARARRSPGSIRPCYGQDTAVPGLCDSPREMSPLRRQLIHLTVVRWLARTRFVTLFRFDLIVSETQASVSLMECQSFSSFESVTLRRCISRCWWLPRPLCCLFTCHIGQSPINQSSRVNLSSRLLAVDRNPFNQVWSRRMSISSQRCRRRESLLISLLRCLR